MFERGERNRRADRARMASLGGYVGRNVGDQPYIMDLVVSHTYLGGLPPVHFATTTTGSGAPSAVTGLPAQRLSTGATASSTIYQCVDTSVFGSAAVNVKGYAADASLRARVRFSAADGEANVFVGFSCSTGVASACDGLFFGIAGATSTASFVCIARNGGVATTAILDGGGSRANIPVDTAWHDVSIICDSTAAAVRFYVDRQLAATITTDLPSDASDYFTPHFSASNGATATARYIDARTIVVAESFP